MSASAQTQGRRHLRHSSIASSIAFCCSPCHASVRRCFSSLTSQISLWLLLLHCFLDRTVNIIQIWTRRSVGYHVKDAVEILKSESFLYFHVLQCSSNTFKARWKTLRWYIRYFVGNSPVKFLKISLRLPKLWSRIIIIIIIIIYTFV